MPITYEDLQSFYEFALGAIETDQPSDSMQDLFVLWNAQRERDSVNDAIRKGHAEIVAEGGRPYDDFRAERL